MLSFRTRCTLAAAFFVLPVGSLAAQSAEPSPAVAQMQTVEDSWGAAVAKRDQFALENLLARDFVGISAEGDVTTRNQQISHLFVAGAEPVSLTQKVIGARVIGDLAVVNGTYVMEWQGASDQQKVAEKGVFTHVFRKNSEGNWQCINSQRTVVATEDERKKKAVEHSSKSNAALPLHIPLIYKGPQSTQKPPAPGTNQPPQ
ncbi:MAG TPA: nuclear transport factor 2 family protein [Acidobacteriaceae bacterium]|nr:nuclear transport factor 2 family protein [Acidobacteriaceae bacterium]